MRSTLLILIPGFAKDETDSTCIPFSQSFIRSLNSISPELEVIVITLDFPFTTKEYSWFGNRIIPLNGTRQLFRPLLWLQLYRLLRKLSNEKQLSGILNFWCADNALVTHYFSKFNTIKHFTWLQGQDARKGNKVLRFFTPSKERLVALSDILRNEFLNNHSINPAYTIYPGINAELFKNGAAEKDIDVIGAGSLTSLKQYSLFIQVIEQLKMSHPSIKAAIIGDGPEKELLKKLIAEKSLEHNIELKGQLSNTDTIRLMQRARLLLHTSSYEGYGMVCLEALAAGCHVVSFISPENNVLEHWHIAKDINEMTEQARKVLSLPGSAFYPVMPRKINNTVKAVLSLFSEDRKAGSLT